MFGAWLTGRCYISGTFEFVESDNDGSSVAELWANCVDDLPENQANLAQVVNRNSSSVRTVLVARPSGTVQRTYASATGQQDDQIVKEIARAKTCDVSSVHYNSIKHARDVSSVLYGAIT